jgi:hypothetical protein
MLPVQAGELAAAGDGREADRLFQEAERAGMMAKRHRSTLAALQVQLEAALTEEKRQAIEAKAKILIEDIEKTKARVEKAFGKLADLWDEIVRIEPVNYENNAISGARILSQFFSQRSFVGGRAVSGGWINAKVTPAGDFNKLIMSSAEACHSRIPRTEAGSENE